MHRRAIPSRRPSRGLPCFCLVLLLAPGMFLVAGNRPPAWAAGRNESRDPDWLILAEHKKVVDETSFYADIINHNREPFKKFDDRPTTAHETSHLIHAYLRNTYARKLGRRLNGFYVGNDRAVLVDEPDVKKRAAAEFVPASLRGDRYRDYIEGQKEWDDTPLYVFDEWVAYVNDATVAVEEAREARPDRSVNNNVYACVEFVVYATALAMAVEKYDPAYFAANDQFRRFLAWHVRRSLRTYRQGLSYAQFRWKPEYFEALRSGTEARPLREFLENKLDLDLAELFH